VLVGCNTPNASTLCGHRCQNNQINIRLGDHSPEEDAERDSNAGSSRDSDRDGFKDFYNVCTVRPGSKFCALIVREDYDERMPGLVFMSPEGKLEMIMVSEDEKENNFSRRSIFGSDCREGYGILFEVSDEGRLTRGIQSSLET
jgi:hypothetical protein